MRIHAIGTIQTYFNGSTSDLICPRCANMHLHHRGVTVFDVAKEDAETAVRTEVSHGKSATRVVANNGENPSSRRGGLVIDFWCEGCGEEKPLQLTIAQHKGSTELSWRFPE